MAIFNFLTREQVVGDDQLDIFRKRGLTCAQSDFATLLSGGRVHKFSDTKEENMEFGYNLWWTQSTTYKGQADAILGDFYQFEYGSHSTNKRDLGVRPCLAFIPISPSPIKGERASDGILEIEYGEYPQSAVDVALEKTLEVAFLEGRINQTGKIYTTDAADPYDVEHGFEERKMVEYEYNGKKYIRFVFSGSDRYEPSYEASLSNGRKVEKGKVYWIEVKPIKWLIDEKTKKVVSAKILFSGIQFKNGKEYQGDFEETDVSRFMRLYFSRDIIPSVVPKMQIDEEKRRKI